MGQRLKERPSRDCPTCTSKRGEALGPEKAQCSTVWEYQDREARLGGWVRRGMGAWDRVFSEGKLGNGIAFKCK